MILTYSNFTLIPWKPSMMKYDSNDNSLQSCSADTVFYQQRYSLSLSLLSIYRETMVEAQPEVPGGRGRELYAGQSQWELDSFKYLEDGGLLQRWSCTISTRNCQVFEFFFLRFSSSGGVRLEKKKY